MRLLHQQILKMLTDFCLSIFRYKLYSNNIYMSKRNKYTIKKYKSKGGAEKKKAKTTRQARRTPKEKNEDFMRVLHKTHNRLERDRKKGETDWLTDEDLKIRDRDMLTAMNTANNATLKGGKRKTRKSKKTRKARKKHKK